MESELNRREFMQATAAGSVVLASSGILGFAANSAGSKIISPGCRGSKVKVARIFLGSIGPGALWPKANMDLDAEIRSYKAEFAKLADELADVDFVVDELVTSSEQLARLKGKFEDVDGILVIQLNIGVMRIIEQLVRLGKPTMIFAIPYSGHDWVSFGDLRKRVANVDCMLTTDYKQLAVAIRPFRAIHHLREAKILNITRSMPVDYTSEIKDKFGTEIKKVDLKEVLDVYNSIPDADAKAEADRWIKAADRVVEPSEEEIVKSCRLALAFEKMLDEENATVMTADCYGSMYKPLCKAHAFPCIGFTRLNNMGLGGICESDLRCAMTHIILQGLCGRPGFISDPTVDESKDTIILAHCLGTNKMDGPNGPSAPFKIRTIMERQEGAVCQVEMRTGQKVTQSILIGTDLMLYFTGEITERMVSLEHDRGCRTKIAVKVDGDITKLWRNWSSGLHRQTCYGDITRELEFFCKFKNIKFVNEAV